MSTAAAIVRRWLERSTWPRVQVAVLELDPAECGAGPTSATPSSPLPGDAAQPRPVGGGGMAIDGLGDEMFDVVLSLIKVDLARRWSNPDDGSTPPSTRCSAEHPAATAGCSGGARCVGEPQFDHGHAWELERGPRHESLLVGSKFALPGVRRPTGSRAGAQRAREWRPPGGTVATDLRGPRSLGLDGVRLDDRPGAPRNLKA